MGCFLLTETMARRHELGMESYDRLFPNQDTMPKGGFGNLIALPLQHEAREHGNTVFLHESFIPYPDQWAYLRSLRPLSPSAVEGIAREATRKGQVLGVRLDGDDDPDSPDKPWERPPSGTMPIRGPLPSQVKAVLAQRLYIEKDGLSSPLLSAIKRLAAFQNPEFYKKQRLRFSTALTPRVIRCFEDHPAHLSLPRGCLDDLSGLLSKNSIKLILEDKREDGEAVDFQFQGILTRAQKEATKALLAHDLGILSAPPGSGKTVMGAYLIAARSRSTLVLVHRKPLMDQWVAQLSCLLGIEPKAIGRIGAGRKKVTGRLDVAMIQSLVRKGEVSDLVSRYGHIVVDECHHVPAVSFEKVLSEAKARYVTGLTATPYRRDGHHPILHMQCGTVRFSMKEAEKTGKGPMERCLIIRETAHRMEAPNGQVPIQRLYAALAADKQRNALIVSDILSALEESRVPLVLTERKDHLDILAEALREKVAHLIVLRGGMATKKHRKELARLREVPAGEPRLVLAIGRYIGEGFDDPRLDTLFLAMPVSWKGTLVQYAGRLNRSHPEKAGVRIYDYVDRQVPVLARMFERRMRGYRALGYGEFGLLQQQELGSSTERANMAKV